MIWLAPKATGIEISPIPKGNVDLLQLLGRTISLGCSTKLNTAHSWKAADSWSMGNDSTPQAVLVWNYASDKI